MNLSGGLITKGLGLPASSGLITMYFHLFATVTITVSGGAGMGGSLPLAPGEINNFYQPIVPESFSGIDPSLINHPIFVDHKDIKKFVTIKIKFGDREIEKEYMVPIRRANIIIKAITIVNSTNHKVKAVINGLQILKRKIVAKISNFNMKNK